MPQEVFQVVVGDGATGAALINSAIDKLVFTGSVATGKRIAQAAAARLLPVVLELGGKDPMLVLDDADIESPLEARSGAHSSTPGRLASRSSAATCIAACTQPFLEACVHRHPAIASRQRHGSGDRCRPADPRTPAAQCRIAGRRRPGARRARAGRVENACRRSARTTTRRRYWPMSPTRCASCAKKPSGRCCRSCRSTPTTKQSVWPTIPTTAWRPVCGHAIAPAGKALARRIHAGTVMVNDAVSCFGISEAPHGGVKASGIGRTHGRFGLEEMVRIKYLDSDRLPGMEKDLVVRIRKCFYAPDGRLAGFSVCPRVRAAAVRCAREL